MLKTYKVTIPFSQIGPRLFSGGTLKKVNTMIISYHGCRQEDLDKLIAGQIEVSLGGGELGRGFYTTLSLYLAKEWVWHKYKSLTVLEIAISD